MSIKSGIWIMLGTRRSSLCGMVLSLCTVVLCASVTLGQESEASGPSPAERYFEIINNPQFHASKTEVKPVGEPQEISDELKMELDWQTGKKCGPVALYFLLQLNGIKDVTLQEILEEVPIEEYGSSLQTLKEVAARHGMNCQIVRVRPETMGNLPFGSIIHWETNNTNDSLREDHFDVYLRMLHDNGQHHVIDTSSCVTKYMSHSVASQMTSGYAMIPAGSGWSRWSRFALWSMLAVVLVANILLGTGVLKP